MSGLKNILEPGLIVVTFTFGTLISYRPSRHRSHDECRPLLHADLQEDAPKQSNVPKWMEKIVPDNSRFRENVTSRFLAAFPFLIEIGYWNLMYWIYQFARAFTAVQIQGNHEVYSKSRTHALSILSFEQSYNFSIERSLQEWITKHVPGLFQVLAIVYYSHIIISIAFLVYAYTYIPRAIYQPIRRTMAGCNLVAFTVLTIYRVMPPRMLPAKYGFVDILHPDTDDSDPTWTNNKFQLTIAAMPSLHFGIAFFIAFSLVRFAPHTPLRILALFWPAVMLFTILATANHFLLDAFVGSLVPVVAWAINEAFLIFLPLEAWIYWMFRTEKPRVADEDSLWVLKDEADGNNEHDIDE